MTTTTPILPTLRAGGVLKCGGRSERFFLVHESRLLIVDQTAARKLASDGWLRPNGIDSHPAAEWAAHYTEDGHTDYHLPSRFELFMCWLSAPQVLNKTEWYLSSSQSSRRSAWIQGFEYGYSHFTDKHNELRARPVRWIHL